MLNEEEVGVEEAAVEEAGVDEVAVVDEEEAVEAMNEVSVCRLPVTTTEAEAEAIRQTRKALLTRW